MGSGSRATRRSDRSPDQEVLEVAAGTGALTVVAARACRRVLATDFSEGMLALLRARCERERLGNVEIAVMDGRALEVEDASFDVGMSNPARRSAWSPRR